VTNAFGGKNKHGLYVPMTEHEQEVLSRLVERKDLQVIVHEWGVVHNPRVSFGDSRVCVKFRLTFDRPEVPVQVRFFDLELKTRAGILLFKQRMPTIYGGAPIQVAAGVFYDLAWDIQIHHMDPKLVKDILPGAFGLTSRRLDKDTGEATFAGNMKLDGNQKRLLEVVTEGTERSKAEDVRKVAKVTKMSEAPMKRTSKGIEVPNE